MRFLVVDDSPADRELMIRKLRELPDAEFVEVTRRRDLEQALSNGGFDIALTDYRLNWTDGLQVLRQIKERHPEVPVVMVTDTGTEEIAVEGMKQGLSDYILKRHLARLPLVVREGLEKVELRRKLDEAARQLQRAHDELEGRVQERTFELAQANEALRHEVAERRAAERALAAERERLAVTLRSIGDAVVATDTEGAVRLMNEVAEQLSEWSEAEAAGRPVWEVFSLSDERDRPLDPSALEGLLRGQAPLRLPSNLGLATKSGNRYTVSLNASPIRDGGRDAVIGMVLVLRDITEQRRLEDDLARANRFEALGLLAGGIAHDFNNLLTAILGSVVLARLEVKDRPEVAEVLLEAERASTRAKDLTQQLLSFSRGGVPVKRAASLAALLRESADFILRGSKATCRLYLADDLWPVEVDEGQIGQVIQNLVLNADEAMPEGGTIRITVDNVELTEEGEMPLPPGRYLRLRVADEGVGIPPGYLEKVFDPYFTTKQKGSGLGLSICYSIVRRHEGHISAESEPGRGTVFTVYLPASRRESVDDAPPLPAPVACDGRVLVMDDEDAVRRVVGRMLQKLGCEVEAVADGAEAVDAYRRAIELGRPFKAVIMDLTVPGSMGGKEAVQELRRIDPEVRAIVSSGYGDDEIFVRYRDHGFAGAIRKPYRFEELSEVLGSVIGTTEALTDG